MTATSFPPVNTQEIYGYRPGLAKVHRTTDYETGEQLTPGTTPITGPMATPASADYPQLRVWLSQPICFSARADRVALGSY